MRYGGPAPHRLKRTLVRAVALFVAVAWLLAPNAPAADDGVQRMGDFRSLPQYASKDGVLNVTLVAAPKKVMVDGVRLDALAFNGEYGGPILRLKPGDRLKLKLVNHTSLPINLHFHGSYASPRANGDNVHVEVAPGTSFDYRLTVPLDQPPGLYWYHTHIHGIAEKEVNAGLSGAMIIDGVENRVPELATVRSRILVLKTFTMTNPSGVSALRLHGIIQSINGATHAEIHTSAGATEFWRISNQSPNDYYHLSIKGVRFRIVAVDGAATLHDIAANQIDIPPAGRIEAMAIMPAAGDYPLLSGSTPTGTGRAMKVNRELAIIKVGPAAEANTANRAALQDVRTGPAPRDLRTVAITGKRLIIFAQVPGQETYLINGRAFDHDRIDTSVPLGSIEEWTIRNDTDDMHAFHIHQLHFQVVSINGAPQPFDSLADTVRVPERGEVTIRIPFTDPQMVGRFVYHCHVLQHEDHGMMANIEVYDPKTGPDLSSPTLLGRRSWWGAWLNRTPWLGRICHAGAITPIPAT